MRDTSTDFPSSTLSSKDSGVSTLSNKKSKNNCDFEPELREKTGPAHPRPVTIAASYSGVNSAPNLLSASVMMSKKTGNKIVKPRMPDPAPEPDQDHVNRIHVSSPPSPMSSSVTNSVYMNVPKHPEYVNFTDSKHQYVNVPDTVSQHSNRRKIFGFLYLLCSRHYCNLKFLYSFIFRAVAKASSCQFLRPQPAADRRPSLRLR